MAELTIKRCDRCGTEIRDPDKASVVTVVTKMRTWFGRKLNDGSAGDLCESCTRALTSWLSRDNATRPGGPGPGWREECSHQIPCGGACPSPHLVRVGR